MPEPVEELHLLLAVAPHRVLGRKVLDELADPRTQLVCEMGRRRADERVDVVNGWLGHGRKPTAGSVA